MHNPIIIETDDIKLGDIISHQFDWSDEAREGEVIDISDYRCWKNGPGYWLLIGDGASPWGLFVRSGDDILVERPA